ncbi:MAG: M14 family zinc carboxypeptidase [Bacteroidales bacterium]
MTGSRHVVKSGATLLLIGMMLATGRTIPAQVVLRYEQNESVTWQEAIAMYHWLDEQYREAMLLDAGWTDAGKPLHLFVISKDGLFSPEAIKEEGKNILFINNGIHPGEPCGIDASLKLAEGLLSGTDPYSRYLDNTVVVIVPVFNIGGSLNRSPYHRANQNGPAEQGFRGNARNLDLNRDFIKLDSWNARSMVEMLREWDPEIFVDTHTSDGADYPYTITLINSQLQRLEPVQAEFMQHTVLPFLFDAMEKTPYPMSPYVWSYRNTPENGIVGFMDYPRYTSGYASMFNTMAFTIETHMFKPFADRVRSTWNLLREMLRFSTLHGSEIQQVRAEAWDQRLNKEAFVLRWSLDTTRYSMLPFRGYRAKTRSSVVTGYPRLYYDRNDPWEAEIPYYQYFTPEVTVRPPENYYLPSPWREVIERLWLNRVEMEELPHDTVMELEVYYIEDYTTGREPYNGHYWHSGTTVRKERQKILLHEGDLVIPVRQPAIEYLVQALEPEGYDSFFSWNFFDEILSRKEYFSPYIFEETAERLLKEDAGLAEAFRAKRSQDSVFREDPYAQLRFIYERSPWAEKSYRRYPVYRQ